MGDLETTVVGGLIVVLTAAIIFWAWCKVFNSRGVRWIQRGLQNLWFWYGIWRISSVLEKWFKSGRRITNLGIGDLKHALSTVRTAKSSNLFSFMQLKQPRLSPRLNDYFISNALERLATKGKLVKLP